VRRPDDRDRHAIPNAPHAERPRPRHRARKRFGQHFLEPAWAAKLIAALQATPGDVFVEIGPGLGALTRPLADTGARIRGVEVDRDLAATLREWAPATVEIVGGDFLALDDAAILPPGDGQVRVVGNLPYNLSSPILFRVLALARATGRVRDAVVMLQREVADRVVAGPGTGDYGPLAVMLGLFADRTRLLALPPGAFRPAPKVHSSVVRLVFRPPVEPIDDVARVDRVVRTAFQQRRKTLANALKPLLQPDADPTPALTGAGIDPTRRPETLTGAEFVHLASALIPLSVL
jgi:16S rRNA (adenine1518-N6/adenine1519-N6)-dimethyltransferase